MMTSVEYAYHTKEKVKLSEPTLLFDEVRAESPPSSVVSNMADINIVALKERSPFVTKFVITPEGTAIRHDIEHQIGEMLKLEAGWLDGEGEKPSVEGLNWLRDKLLDCYTAKVPELNLYPTEDGNVLAEWWIGSHDITLEIDLSSGMGYWHDYDSSIDQTHEQEINCNKRHCWTWMKRKLRNLS